ELAGALSPRGPEASRVERRAVAVESETPAGEREAFFDQLRELSVATHARAESRIVVATAAYLLHHAHDVLCAQRIVLCQPVPEKRGYLARQPQHDPPGPAGTVRRSCLENRFEVAVVELRDHRRDADPHRNAGIGERLHHLQPAARRGSPWIELARELRVEHC